MSDDTKSQRGSPADDGDREMLENLDMLLDFELIQESGENFELIEHLEEANGTEGGES